MDVLLINPNSRKDDYVDEPPLITPPINLMYIAQTLEDNGYKSEIIDAFALNLTENQTDHFSSKSLGSRKIAICIKMIINHFKN